jgi:hypothetical protein
MGSDVGGAGWLARQPLWKQALYWASAGGCMLAGGALSGNWLLVGLGTIFVVVPLVVHATKRRRSAG